VATLEPCRLMSLQKSLVQEVVHADPEIALHLQEGLARRVRKLTESVRTLALLDVFGPLARTLDELAVERDGQRVIEPRPTQQDIANRIGASREMVSRILTDLARGGYIQVEDKQIVIRRKIPSHW
jgi:CRP/FNR family cyclic AMP-dependent transcriptional regulator